MIDWKRLLWISIFFLILDGIWLGILARNFYSTSIKRVTNLSSATFRLYSAIITYILMVLGIYYWVLPKVKESDDIGSLFWGGFFGLMIYGIYNFTNHAIFAGWDLKTSLVDTLWGITVCSLVTYLTIKFT